MVRDMHIPDFDLKSKMQIQLENLGYIDLTTNRKEDQRKLIVMDIYPLKSKENGNIWAYALQVRSIGTGKQTVGQFTLSFTIVSRSNVLTPSKFQPMVGAGDEAICIYTNMTT